ncbi:MAG: purine-nucleoside phosphorylase [Firmicutes bacterium]|nr:purine-nucleoside phosphorylase [Bacillota bacterium]MDI6706877.1 purine-nucleoside phosphorylase [Bacillota bacterium]
MIEYHDYARAAEYISARLSNRPLIGLILGSGLGEMAEQVENKTIIDYSEIPGFPVSTVEGHAGRLVAGKLMGKELVVMQGRFHYYEGYSLDEVTFPVRVMKLIGVEYLIVTNAAGGVNSEFAPGDLMVITDHINLLGANPLRGKNLEKMGPRFPDMSRAYDRDLIDVALNCAGKAGIKVHRGVYCAMQGPSYETPAEIRMARIIGGDAVGMSTVPEVIAANHCGIRVLGISCITNMAAGILDQPLKHEEVIEVGKMARKGFIELIKGVVEEIC